MKKVFVSKREHREELANRPVREKLRILDELHHRARVLQSARRADDGTESRRNKSR